MGWFGSDQKQDQNDKDDDNDDKDDDDDDDDDKNDDDDDDKNDDDDDDNDKDNDDNDDQKGDFMEDFAATMGKKANWVAQKLANTGTGLGRMATAVVAGPTQAISGAFQLGGGLSQIGNGFSLLSQSPFAGFKQGTQMIGTGIQDSFKGAASFTGGALATLSGTIPVLGIASGAAYAINKLKSTKLAKSLQQRSKQKQKEGIGKFALKMLQEQGTPYYQKNMKPFVSGITDYVQQKAKNRFNAVVEGTRGVIGQVQNVGQGVIDLGVGAVSGGWNNTKQYFNQKINVKQTMPSNSNSNSNPTIKVEEQVAATSGIPVHYDPKANLPLNQLVNHPVVEQYEDVVEQVIENGQTIQKTKRIKKGQKKPGIYLSVAQSGHVKPKAFSQIQKKNQIQVQNMMMKHN